jgi:hypothetical protein
MPEGDGAERRDSPETLSSFQTFFVKFVVPVLLLCALGAIVLSLFLTPGSWRDAPGNPAATWFVLAGAVVAGFFYWQFAAGLKAVRMDATSLYVSNYREELVVPLTNVADVTENRWIKGRPVTIHFHAATEFGDRITFLPTLRMWMFPWVSHPVVAQIRQAADRASGHLREAWRD